MTIRINGIRCNGNRWIDDDYIKNVCGPILVIYKGLLGPGGGEESENFKRRKDIPNFLGKLIIWYNMFFCTKSWGAGC